MSTEHEINEYIEELENQNEFKSELISTSAHQVRTSLTANKWALKEILNENNGPVTPEQRDLIEKLLENNEQMIKTLTELIDVNHTEESHPKYEFKLTDVHDIIQRVVSDFQGEAVEKDVALSFDDTSESHFVIGDNQKLITVFQALVENAIKYSHPGGSVTVHTEIDDDHMVTSVTDEGIGIPEEEQENIFQKFYRAENAQAMQSIGSGIGLFSAAHVVTAHGGDIWFKSKEGTGATFFVSLPLPKDEDIVE
jgi:signal transduction histidine kinase